MRSVSKWITAIFKSEFSHSKTRFLTKPNDLNLPYNLVIAGREGWIHDFLQGNTNSIARGSKLKSLIAFPKTITLSLSAPLRKSFLK